MNKPLWAAAGVALLGVAGITGVLVASSGGEEEVAVQGSPLASVTPPASASPGGPTPSSEPSVDTPSPTGATAVYTDPTYGYSFEYPETWYLSPPKDNGGQLILYSYDFTNVPPEQAGMPLPKDKLKVFFWVAEGIDKPIDQWLGEERARASAEQNLPPPAVISQSPASLGGKQGLSEVTESEGIKHISYYIDIGGGRVFVVNAVPADSQVWPDFEGVLASIRFPP